MFDNDKKISRQTWISATFLLIFAALVSKGLGFIREILIARNFGISSDVDAYLVALSIPSLIGGTIGSAFSVSIVPLYHQMLNKGSSGKAAEFIKTVFSFTVIVSLIIMAVIWLFPEAIIRLIAPSLSAGTMDTAVELLKWLFLVLIGYSLYNVLSSVYNAIHHFKIPAFTDMFSNLFIIAALVFLSSAFGIYALVTGMAVSSYFVMIIFILHLLYHKLIGFNSNFRSEAFKEFLLFVAPVLLFMFFQQLSSIIENYFASSLKEGSIASLGYAKRLYDIIPTLLIANIARAVFPTFSTLYSEQKIDALRDLVIKLNKQFVIYFLPVSFALIFFRKEIITVVFMRGAFDETALELTSRAFMFYAAGLTAATLIPVFFRLCYAFSDSISPLIAVFFTTAFMILLNYFLTPVMGIAGIALANSITVFFSLFLLGFLVRKKIGGIDLKELGKSIIVSFLCAVAALIPFYYISFANPYLNLVLIGAYFTVYLMLGLLVARKEFGTVWIILKRTISPGKNV